MNKSLLLALDLGTTTLGGRLVDEGGRLLAEARTPNPQQAVAGDVIRRLEAARSGEAERLQEMLVAGVETLVAALTGQAGVSREAIARAAAAGNPAMTCLLRRLPVDSLLFPPHRPADRAGRWFGPGELPPGLPAPLYLFPLISGYVGGDLVAFLFSLPAPRPGTFFLDVGTNGEMALFTGREWWVTSVAAGPAFEGGGISCGMPLGKGAVAGVRLEEDRLRLEVVGDGPPRGVCGSGLADAVAAALAGGLLDSSGRIVAPAEVATNLARHVHDDPAGRFLRLYRDAAVDLRLTQEDIRSFQLAKGAVRAGAECLLQRAGLAAGALQEVVVTGAFGYSLAPQTLKRVAMLPPNMVDKVRFEPEGVLSGLGRFLGDPDGEAWVQTLADRLRAYPLSGTPAFEKAFLQALDF